MANDRESGLELVVDNRKLIIAFVLLIAICGGFFVVGFMEGKRQGLQEGAQAPAQPAENFASSQPDSSTPIKEGNAAASGVQESVEQRLDWYRNVNSPDAEPEPIRETISNEPPKASVVLPPVVPRGAAKEEANKRPVTYSVQVGAFLQKQELETRAKALRAKGYDAWTDPPGASGEFYLLKIGRYKSRAEAAAMQMRLKKSGIPSFIKTN